MQKIQQPNDANIFNILTFWKLIKTRHSERERDMLDNIKNLADGKALDMLKRIVDNMQSMEVMPQSDESAVNEQHDFLSNNEIKRIISLTEKGHLSKAAKLIEKETKGIADINQTTVHEMTKLNPHGAANPFGNWNGPRGNFIEDTISLFKLIEKMNPQAAPGIDGWTADRIKMSYGTPNDGDKDYQAFRNFLRIYYTSMANGTAPGKTMMLSARGTP